MNYSKFSGRSQTMEDLPPEKRGEVMEVVDELGETVELEVLILVDTSASMKHKLADRKRGLLDLSLSFNARTGDNHFPSLYFPGKRMMSKNSGLDTKTTIFDKYLFSVNNWGNYSNRTGHSNCAILI